VCTCVHTPFSLPRSRHFPLVPCPFHLPLCPFSPFLPVPLFLSLSLPLPLALSRALSLLYLSPCAQEPAASCAQNNNKKDQAETPFAISRTPAFQVKMERLYTDHLDSLKADSPAVREGSAMEDKQTTKKEAASFRALKGCSCVFAWETFIETEHAFNLFVPLYLDFVFR